MHNPYAPPEARLENPEEPGLDLARVASGQKLVIYGVLLYLLTSIAMATIVFGVLLVIPAVILGLVGIFRIGGGFGWSLAARVLLVVTMLVPLIGLITLLVVNRKANNALRAGGYRVGLLGARQ